MSKRGAPPAPWGTMDGVLTPANPPPFGSAGTRALSIAVPLCLASDREQRQHLQMFCVRFSFCLFVFWAELLGIRAM